MNDRPSADTIHVASLVSARTMDQLRTAFWAMPREKQQQYEPLKDLMKTIIEDMTP